MAHQEQTDRPEFLIIGASGFLGGTLRQYLRAHGRSVIGTSTTGSQSGLLKFELGADRIGEVLADKAWPAYAVVGACVSQIDRCSREREYTRQINIEATQRAIKELHQAGVKLIYISTSYVFDGRAGNYSEDADISPCCEYGRQKAEMESWLQTIPDAAVLRLDKLVSDERHPRNLFHQWREEARQTGVIRCIAGQRFSPTATSDVAQAIERTAELELRGVYHVAAPEFLGRGELAEQFVQLLGIRAEIRELRQGEFSFDDPRPLNSSLSNHRFSMETGLRFTSMREVMQRYRNHLRQDSSGLEA